MDPSASSAHQPRHSLPLWADVLIISSPLPPPPRASSRDAFHLTELVELDGDDDGTSLLIPSMGWARLLRITTGRNLWQGYTDDVACTVLHLFETNDCRVRAAVGLYSGVMKLADLGRARPILGPIIRRAGKEG
jgi:hypothetical protein